MPSVRYCRALSIPLFTKPVNVCECLSHVSPVEQLPYHCGKYQEANSIIHWYCHSLTLDSSPSGLRDSGGCEAKEMRAAQGGMAASCSATLSSCEKKRGKGVSEESSFLTHFTESRHRKIEATKELPAIAEQISFTVVYKALAWAFTSTH